MTGGELDPRRWEDVERYLADLLLPADPALDGALATSAAAELPPIQVPAAQGALLQLLARLVTAAAILEIGTLGGYSTIWLARALPPGGHLVSLEIDPERAALARGNLARAGLAEVAEIRVGPAIDSLAGLAAEGAGPYDLVFIDADKPSNPAYVAAALDLTRPGGLVVVDNVVRGGAVADPASTDPAVLGTRRALEMLAADPRVTAATALQTVGAKGYDGFAVALRGADAGASAGR